MQSYDRSTIIKTLIRKDKEKFDVTTTPMLTGLFIKKDDTKFYSNYWLADQDKVINDEELLIGFIQSMELFTNEFSCSPVLFSILKFGKSHLLIETHFEYMFIFFIQNMDQTNYNFVTQKIKAKSTELFNIIKLYDREYFSNYLTNVNISAIIIQLGIELLFQLNLLEK